MTQMHWSFITGLCGSMGVRRKFMACSEYVSPTHNVNLTLITWYFSGWADIFLGSLSVETYHNHRTVHFSWDRGVHRVCIINRLLTLILIDFPSRRLNRLTFGDAMTTVHGNVFFMLYSGPWGSCYCKGAEHRRQRKILNSVFSATHMRALVPIIYNLSAEVRYGPRVLYLHSH
jgi:hypothetical protein